MEIVYSLKTGRWVKKSRATRLPRKPRSVLVCGNSRTPDEIDAFIRRSLECGPLPLSVVLRRGDTLTLREDPTHCAVLLEVVESPTRPLKGLVVASDTQHHKGRIFYYSLDDVVVGPKAQVPEVEEPIDSISLRMQGKIAYYSSFPCSTRTVPTGG